MAASKDAVREQLRTAALADVEEYGVLRRAELVRRFAGQASRAALFKWLGEIASQLPGLEASIAEAVADMAQGDGGSPPPSPAPAPAAPPARPAGVIPAHVSAGEAAVLMMPQTGTVRRHAERMEAILSHCDALIRHSQSGVGEHAVIRNTKLLLQAAREMRQTIAAQARLEAQLAHAERAQAYVRGLADCVIGGVHDLHEREQLLERWRSFLERQAPL